MINKLVDKIQKTQAPIVVGLDPMLSYIPEHILKKAYAEYGETLEGAAEAVWQYNKEIVDHVYDLIPAVKPQIAMYEQFGIEGLKAFQKTVAYCKSKDLVVVVNKWDLVEEKNQKVIDTFENAIRNRMAPFVDFPIIFASALTKQRIFRVLETAKEVYLNRKIHIGTSKLNEVMLPIIEAYPPQSVKGKYIKIKYCTQLPNTTIPSFVFYANLPQYVKENYRRFLENKIRDNWSLHGCPINVFIRQK